MELVAVEMENQSRARKEQCSTFRNQTLKTRSKVRRDQLNGNEIVLHTALKSFRLEQNVLSLFLLIDITVTNLMCLLHMNGPFAGPGHVTYPPLNLRPGTL